MVWCSPCLPKSRVTNPLHHHQVFKFHIKIGKLTTAGAAVALAGLPGVALPQPTHTPHERKVLGRVRQHTALNILHFDAWPNSLGRRLAGNPQARAGQVLLHCGTPPPSWGVPRYPL